MDMAQQNTDLKHDTCTFRDNHVEHAGHGSRPQMKPMLPQLLSRYVTKRTDGKWNNSKLDDTTKGSP